MLAGQVGGLAVSRAAQRSSAVSSLLTVVHRPRRVLHHLRIVVVAATLLRRRCGAAPRVAVAPLLGSARLWQGSLGVPEPRVK